MNTTGNAQVKVLQLLHKKLNIYVDSFENENNKIT